MCDGLREELRSGMATGRNDFLLLSILHFGGVSLFIKCAPAFVQLLMAWVEDIKELNHLYQLQTSEQCM